MVLYIICAIFEATISLSNICYKQMLHYTLCVLVKVFWELNFTFQDLLIDCHRVIIIKWIDSCEHFIG